MKWVLDDRQSCVLVVETEYNKATHIQLLIFRETHCCSHVVTGKEDREVVFRKSNTKGNYWRRMKRGRWRDMVSDIRRGRTGSEYGKGEIDSKRY